MLYNNAIEFNITTWRQSLETEFASGVESVHLSLTGYCEGVRVLCGIWHVKEPAEDSGRRDAHGSFETTQYAHSLSELRANASKARLDVFVSSEFYNRILGLLVRREGELEFLEFSVSYEIRDNDDPKYCRFKVHSIEVQEGRVE